MKPEVSEKLFVEELFQKSLNEGKVSDFSGDIDVDKLTGDASTRRYYRVGNLNKSYVVCLDQPQENGNFQGHPFMQVQMALKENGVRVPEIFDVELARGYFLEEDLGDSTLLSVLGRTKDTRQELDLYERAVDELVKIHELQKSSYLGKAFTQLEFNAEKLMSEVETSLEYLIKGYLAPQCSADFLSKIRHSFKGICDELAQKEKIVCHRDFHSRNIMLPKEKDLVVIDFQDARLGVPQYDLCSLLDDCYYKIEMSNKEKLLNRYWENSRIVRELYGDYDKFYEDYLLSSAQRLFKALGSFAYIYHKRDDIRYLKYVSFGFESLRGRLKELSKGRRDASELLLCLSEIYYDS